jgi:hypothetical protein
MNSNHVGALYPDSFGNFGLGIASTVYCGATANVAGTIAINPSSYIIRRITVNNPTGSVALANVTILTSSDGNTSNAVTNAAALSNVTGTNTYQDLPLATGTVTKAYSGALYVYIGTNAAANNAVDVQVYGDVVNL